jgi:acetyl-CoA/propionyl-CoA carboxylase, biotin carboxylase, biotin carboxyl carrier protein
LSKEKTHDVTVTGGPDGAAPARTRRLARTVEVAGKRFDVGLLEPQPPWADLARRRRERASGGRVRGGAAEDVVSPMQGTVLAVEVAEGDEVRAGQVICIVEAMKMENEVHAHRDGFVRRLSVAAGQSVTSGQVMCRVEPE